MEFDHDFTVPVSVDQAWSVLLDVERVASCAPGATLDSIDGDECRGRFKVRLGAMTITYRGTARIVEADESARTVVIEAQGKEARGSGTAEAAVTARLSEEDGATRVAVHATVHATGRPTQVDRDTLAEVGARLLNRFAKALAADLAENPPSDALAEQPSAEQAPTERPSSEQAAAERPPAREDSSARSSAEQTGDAAAEAAASPAEEGTGASSDAAGDVSSTGTDAPGDAVDAGAGTGPTAADGDTTAEAADPGSDAGAPSGEAASEDGTASGEAAPADEAPADRGDDAGPAVDGEAAGRVPGVLVEPKDPVGGVGLSLGPQVPAPREAADRPAAPHASDGDGGTAERLTAVPAPRPAADDRPRRGGAHRRRDDDAVDMLQVSGPSVAKRAAPALGALAALLAVRYLFRRRRGRHHR